ncbi:MAG: acyltransferase [Rhodospirillales bacterium]|nr:acyltransferase [Rhodospirillales bacterium]
MSQKPDITDLTICRAAFAAWVFIYHVDLHLHFSQVLGGLSVLITHGYMGVDGFFILSGLVLLHTHREFDAVEHGPLRTEFRWATQGGVLRFYAKRLVRIYPVHLATIFILLALVGGSVALGMPPHSPQRFGLATLVENLFLVQGWGADHFGAWNYPAWSVSTEWAGYLLFPLFALILTYFIRDVSVQVIIAIFPILGVIYFFSGHSLNLAFGAGLIRFFPEFIAGMAAWRITSSIADYTFARRIFLWIGVMLLLGGAVLGVDLVTVIGLWSLIFAFYLQADSERPPLLGRRPVLHFLGLLSYCFYMSFAIAELLTVRAFQHFGWQPTGQKLIFAAMMTALTFILAILLRGFVEQPCRRAANRWLQVAPTPLSVPVTEKPQSLF